MVNANFVSLFFFFFFVALQIVEAEFDDVGVNTRLVVDGVYHFETMTFGSRKSEKCDEYTKKCRAMITCVTACERFLDNVPFRSPVDSITRPSNVCVRMYVECLNQSYEQLSKALSITGPYDY